MMMPNGGVVGGAAGQGMPIQQQQQSYMQSGHPVAHTQYSSQVAAPSGGLGGGGFIRGAPGVYATVAPSAPYAPTTMHQSMHSGYASPYDGSPHVVSAMMAAPEWGPWSSMGQVGGMHQHPQQSWTHATSSQAWQQQQQPGSVPTQQLQQHQQQQQGSPPLQPQPQQPQPQQPQQQQQQQQQPQPPRAASPHNQQSQSKVSVGVGRVSAPTARVQHTDAERLAAAALLSSVSDNGTSQVKSNAQPPVNDEGTPDGDRQAKRPRVDESATSSGMAM
jgi:hypothetical protein